MLRDLIESECFPVVRLTRIFRQAQTSRIILNAHRINVGKMPDISNGKNTDFFFMERSEPEQAVQTIADLVKTRLPRSFGVSPSDIQALTPMQRGETGAANLNQVLQQQINPGETGLRRGGYLFRERDKVMQIRNNYEKEVFNGDIGLVTGIDMEDRTLDVLYDDRVVRYDVTELDELVLAYATTIHKAQGSEYPVVVMPILMNHYVMLQRNLVYTGVTRAKKALVIIGTRKALAYAVRHVTVENRNTMLRERLKRLEGAEEAAAKPETEPVNTARDAWMERDLFERLAQSKFRSRFHLNEAERRYAEKEGEETLRAHAHEIIGKRLAPADIPNDGKQTPMSGYPVFVAQHATATCCRGCLAKWHGIEKGRELSMKEQDYVVDVLVRWIQEDTQSSEKGT